MAVCVFDWPMTCYLLFYNISLFEKKNEKDFVDLKQYFQSKWSKSGKIWSMTVTSKKINETGVGEGGMSARK